MDFAVAVHHRVAAQPIQVGRELRSWKNFSQTPSHAVLLDKVRRLFAENCRRLHSDGFMAFLQGLADGFEHLFKQQKGHALSRRSQSVGLRSVFQREHANRAGGHYAPHSRGLNLIGFDFGDAEVKHLHEIGFVRDTNQKNVGGRQIAVDDAFGVHRGYGRRNLPRDDDRLWQGN